MFCVWWDFWVEKVQKLKRVNVRVTVWDTGYWKIATRKTWQGGSYDTNFALQEGVVQKTSESINILNITQDAYTKYTNEFRRIQEASRNLSDEEISQYHRGRAYEGKKLSDSDKRVLGATYAGLLSRRNDSGKANGFNLSHTNKQGKTNHFRLIQVNGSSSKRSLR